MDTVETNFTAFVKEWMGFPFKESQKIWSLVKEHNRNGGGLEGKIDCRKVYEMMNVIKAEGKDERKE